MKIFCEKGGGVWYLENCWMQCVETTREQRWDESAVDEDGEQEGGSGGGEE